MFFDPQCKPEASPVTKPDIYALPTLIAWLEKQPASTLYDYWNCSGGCLLGQYLGSFGAYDKSAMMKLDGATGWVGAIARIKPRTFGAALERARALL